jgi:hypothetical protein
MKLRKILFIFVLCSITWFLRVYATDVNDFKVNDDFGSTYQGYSNIATDLNGDFVVCWYDKRNGNNDIYIQLFDRNGTREGSNRRVNDDTGTNDQLKPSMLKDQSGKFVVVWQDYRVNGYPFNGDIMGQRFLADGTVQGANFKTNDDYGTETQGWQDIDCDDYGNFVVVWEDNRNGNYDIYAQRYHKSGTKLGSNFRVNDDAGASYQHNPRVTVDGTGNFIVVWYDNRSSRDDILAQRYNSSGVAQGTNFMVNENIKNEKHVMPDVACDYNGNFTVVWIDYRNGTYPANPDIYGKMFFADGSSRSGNFKINADGSQAAQQEPAIGMDYFGNYIVAWRDEREGNNDIYAQYYDNTGRLVGANYRVNTDAGTSTQSFPNVTMDGINIYYTWTDDRNGSFDVYAKISEYGSPSMVITPLSFQFSAELGGSNPAGQNLLISNLGYGILNWRATTNQSWLQVTPSSATAPSTAVVSVNIAGLAHGSYNGRITIADVSGKDSSKTAVVTLDVTAPVMQLIPQSMNIEAHLGVPPPDDKFVQINNSGSGTLNWSLSGVPNWLKFSMTSGTAPSATDIIILTDSLPGPGMYSANVTVTSAQAVNSPLTLAVNLSYLADTPIIATDPDTVNLTFAVNATNIATQELVIFNVGVSTLNWTVVADATWVSLSTDAGVGDGVINVGAIPGQLSVGDHFSNLSIIDNAAYNSPYNVAVHAHVTDVPPVISVSPDSISFLCYDTGPQDSSRAVTVANIGGGSMPWTMTKNAVWLTFAPSSGTNAGQTVASVSTGGLPIGNYSTWVFFNASSSSNLKDSLLVRLQIAAWVPKICGLPANLQFMARENLPFVDTQTVTVNTCAASGMNWSLATSPSWLSASPSSGTEGQSAKIIMTTTGQAAGSYNGQATVTASTASNSPVSVPINLQVYPVDTVALSTTRVVAGQTFALGLRLHNMLPVDSVLLRVQYDNSTFAFDSISAGQRVSGVLVFQVVGHQSLGAEQTTITSLNTASQVSRGNGDIATLYLRAIPTVTDGTYPISCIASLRDSLGLVTTTPTSVSQVEVQGQTPVEPNPVAELPHDFQLHQNYPNPFNSSTTVHYSLERGADVRLEVLNILGQSVRTLFVGRQSAGGYGIEWDGCDDQSCSVGSGIYFVQLSTELRSDHIKVILLK